MMTSSVMSGVGPRGSGISAPFSMRVSVTTRMAFRARGNPEYCTLRAEHRRPPDAVPRPEENGDHVETRWLRVTGRLPADPARTHGGLLFDFSARRWTTEDLENARRPSDLRDSGRVWLNLATPSKGSEVPRAARPSRSPTASPSSRPRSGSATPRRPTGGSTTVGCGGSSRLTDRRRCLSPAGTRRARCASARTRSAPVRGRSRRASRAGRGLGHRIATGFVGTPIVSDALTSTGHVDAAYDLLLEQEAPSWLYAVRQGARTVWERWDSLRPDGTVNPGTMTSFNHTHWGRWPAGCTAWSGASRRRRRDTGRSSSVRAPAAV